MFAKAPRKRELIGEPQGNQPPPKKTRNDRQMERRFRKRKLHEVLDELCLRVEKNDRQLTNNLIRELDTEHVRVISEEDFEATCTKMLKACLTAKNETVSNKMLACLMSMFGRGSLQKRRDFVNSLQNYCEGLATAINESAEFNAAEANSSSETGTSESEASLGSDNVKSQGEVKEKKNKKFKKEKYAKSEGSRKSSRSNQPEGFDRRVLKEEDEEITMIDAFFLKPSLDCGVLSIYTMVLEEKVIQAHEVPEKIKLCARRSLAHAALSKTANRTTAIEFNVALAISTSSPETESDEYPNYQILECESLLNYLSVDRDFRVRKAVSEGLLALSNVYKLSKSTYYTAKSFMKDSDSTVRIAAIRLLIHYANKRGDEVLDEMNEKDEKSTTTISDDAFSAICDAMNDIEIAVRVEAAKKLGDFDSVSEDLIYQTLDKKMMRSSANQQVVKVEQSLFALSKKASVNKDRRWKFARKAPKVEEARGGWSRGKELNATCPTTGKEEEKEKEEEEGESIIPHGACGAFVSALEDEFMDVRKAAVYSLGRLACSRPAFAVSALEYLADMFNDEIADVRLDAINALTPLIAHGQLNSEQLNVISKCLDDAMPESRQAMRELLKRAQFVDVNCIEMCVKALLACLKRFPKDKEQVYSCMAEIGLNHAVQVQSIMRSLLDIHLIFHTREPSIEDEEYVGKLIMVLNAASNQTSMVHFMPEFVHRHYRFLRNSFPNLVRAIRMIDEEKQIGKIRSDNDTTNEKAEEVVLNTYHRLCDVTNTAQLIDRNLKRDDIFRDATAISLYNSSVSGAARLIFCLGEVSSTVDSVTNTVLCGGELTNVKQLISQSIEDMQSIEHQFSGISSQIHSYLVYCRVYLSFLDMLVWMMQVMAPQNDVMAAGQLIIQDARNSISEHREMSASLSEFISTCESIFMPPIQIPLTAGAVDDKRKIITPTTLVEFLNRSIPALPPKFPPVATIHLKYAKITNPNKDTAIEEVLKFFALLPHGIPLEFDLYNMRADELELVRIKTIHPDGRFDVMRPRLEEIREENGHFSVSTQVKITCSTPWSEPAEIDLIIGVFTNNTFVPLFASPSCFSPAHIRVRIHPQSR